MAKKISEQEINRRNSLSKIRELGINPFPAESFDIDSDTVACKEEFVDKKNVKIAGRIMSKRVMGKASFAEIQDSNGRIQLYLNRDEICNTENKILYNEVFKKLLDIGDIIGVQGFLFKTKVGEISIWVKNFIILSKSIKPLPVTKIDEKGNKYDEFSNLELKYRRRYVDLIVNENTKKVFINRNKIISVMRNFFNDYSYLEVETPILQGIPGGASARPFKTHHNSLNVPLYLRIANELYLKRLIVGGFNGVFEFAKCFRNEGMDKTHNPEFTMLEIYVAYKDYFWMMNFTEKLFEKISLELNNSSIIKVGENEINLKPPFERISITDVIIKYANIDISKLNTDQLKIECEKLNIDSHKLQSKSKLIDAIFSEKCESKLIQPTFIVDYPKEMSPLCKTHRKNKNLTERFELFINGKEIANAYSELNDPIDQEERFKSQMKLLSKGDDEAMIIDQDFIRSLEYGMPPTSGMGIGIDRLTMLITNQPSIQDVIFFPQMKPEK